MGESVTLFCSEINEWLDTAENLNYPGLLDFPAWYSRFKGEYVPSFSECQERKKIVEEKGSKRSRTGSMLHGDKSLGKGESLLH